MLKDALRAVCGSRRKRRVINPSIEPGVAHERPYAPMILFVIVNDVSADFARAVL